MPKKRKLVLGGQTLERVQGRRTGEPEVKDVYIKGIIKGTYITVVAVIGTGIIN